MKKSILTTVIGLALISSTAMADDGALKAQLEKMGATNVAISDSPLKGFRTVVADQGVLQMSEDGKYMMQGKLMEIKNGQPIDITNKPLMSELNSLKEGMIVYPAKNQKQIVTVFTDITCPYCHKLFEGIKEYNDLGITIRLAAFPRAGLSSKAAQQMEAIWTAKDKMKVLSDAENGTLPTQLKTADVVKKHYALGNKFGISGTPAIITENGEVIGGYVEPKALAQMLAE